MVDSKKQSEILLHHIAVVELSPLEDVLLTDDVRVDEKVAVTHAEVLLAGGAFEALQMVNLVSHTHRHLKRPDPLFTGSTQTVLTKEPEWSANKTMSYDTTLTKIKESTMICILLI